MSLDSAFLGGHVDSTVEQRFEVRDKTGLVEQRRVRGEGNQQVDVAVRCVCTARNRAEQANVTRVVPGRYSENLITMLSDRRGRRRFRRRKQPTQHRGRRHTAAGFVGRDVRLPHAGSGGEVVLRQTGCASGCDDPRCLGHATRQIA
jgi:hypothetical protein